MTEYLDYLTKNLRLNQLDLNQNLYFIQKKLGIKPSAFFVAVSIFVIIVSLISNAANIVTGLVCCFIPGFFTFTALQSQEKQDDIKYLTYWVLFSLVQCMSPLLNLILSPMIYMLLRVGVTVILLHPSINLTAQIYSKFVHPFFKKYESKIDNNIENAYEKGKKKGEDILNGKY